MRRLAFIIIIAAIFYTGCSSGIKLGKQDLIPKESTEEQQENINRGIAAFDNGDYESAVQFYENVLAENPDNVIAIYELSYTYLAKKQWAECLELAQRGTNYESSVLPSFYDLIGSCLDNQGSHKKAIAVYKKAVNQFPDSYLLQFNMALTYYHMTDIKNSRKCLKRALILNPNHPSSHLLLGNVYYDTDNFIPALLAYCRFLILEPSSERSDEPRNRIEKIINHGVEFDSDDNSKITVYSFTDMPADDGDFAAVSLALNMIFAQSIMDDSSLTDAEAIFVNVIDKTFIIMGELSQNDPQTGFGWEYYAPYFVEMQKQGMVPAFVRYIFQVEGRDQAEDTIFLSWSENYFNN